MRKMITLVLSALLLSAIISGCGSKMPEKGDFSFDLPEGFSVSDVTDQNCSIVHDEDGTAVGGIELTQLKRRDLKDSDTINAMKYVQHEFHKTNDIEFFASNWGDKHPIITINLTKYEDDSEEKHDFSHIFFENEKDSGVYHMWFDLAVIDSDIADNFISLTGVD